MQYDKMQYDKMQYDKMQYDKMQYDKMQYDKMQYNSGKMKQNRFLIRQLFFLTACTLVGLARTVYTHRI
jgi:hypothetical protein